MDIYGLLPDDGYLGLNQHTEFVHEAFEFKNKFDDDKKLVDEQVEEWKEEKEEGKEEKQHIGRSYEEQFPVYDSSLTKTVVEGQREEDGGEEDKGESVGVFETRRQQKIRIQMEKINARCTASEQKELSELHEQLLLGTEKYSESELTFLRTRVQTLSNQAHHRTCGIINELSYSFEDIKDLLPISFHTGMPISKEEWEASYSGYHKLTCSPAGQIRHYDPLREKLRLCVFSQTYESLPVINRAYKILPPWKSLEEEKQNYGVTIDAPVFDYNLIKDDDSVLSYINRCSDFSFTKVAYDGQKIYIQDLDSLLLQRATVWVENMDYERRLRDGKLGVYGEFCRKRFYYRLICRQLKYMERGFQVKVIFHNAQINKEELGAITQLHQDELKSKNLYSMLGNKEAQCTPGQFRKLCHSGDVSFVGERNEKEDDDYKDDDW